VKTAFRLLVFLIAALAVAGALFLHWVLTLRGGALLATLTLGSLLWVLLPSSPKCSGHHCSGCDQH
jgi:hypothetical protein